jgi:lipopolysaccharide transport system permease protein
MNSMVKKNTEHPAWKEVILPHSHLFRVNVKELWYYRDLLFIFVRRDILAIYKQTILGPLWFFLQPVLTTVVYIFIFSKAAGISTDGLPPVIFYLSSLALWGYFAECIVRTSSFLKDNNAILGKVYFPRLIIPISLIITNLVKFAIQLLVFFLVYFYFLLFRNEDGSIQPNIYVLLLPLLILAAGMMGLGAGLFVASLTTRYKDLLHLITFGVQLLMFGSSVILPLSSLGSNLQEIAKLNPLTGLIESFRYGFLGKGYFSWSLLTYDLCFIIVLVAAGLFAFNLVEKSFADTM